jgi:protein gp37
MTTIQWTQETWNPVRGCTHVSEGCRHCYAERQAARNLPGMKSPTTGGPFAVMTPSGPRWTGKVELIPHMLDVPLKRKKRTIWFVNSMSDLFHESLRWPEITKVFDVMRQANWHTYQVLTKRAENLAKFADHWAIHNGGALPDVWLGVSVEDRKNLERIDHLRSAPAAVRFLSLEPLLEDLGTLDLRGIDWVIVGGESGPGARVCDVAWTRSIMSQCKAAGVACFMKQLGARPTNSIGPAMGRLTSRKGDVMSEWPPDLRMREMPGSTKLAKHIAVVHQITKSKGR